MGRVKRVPVVMQMEALECGAASLGMVLAYWKKWLPLERLRIDCGVSRDGSNALNILKAARKYGMVAKGFRMEVERLRKVEAPAILHWNFCHFVVFNGFKGDKVSLSFSIQPRRVYADPRVRENSGKVCLMRGPLVYCLEAVDNGKALCRLHLPRSVSIVTAHEKDEDIGSFVSLRFTGLKEKNFKRLYEDHPPEAEPVPVKAVPYFLWGNRKQGAMQVWINEA